jgi:signal transduction histidine kinase/CheY-like chemotaxis protein
LHRENRALWIIGVNLFLVLSIAAVVVFSTVSYRRKLEQQNIDDITNINRSAANISGAFFRNQQKRLADAIQYANARGLDQNGILLYLCDSNSDGKSNYELIGPDGKGYVTAKGRTGFFFVDYSSADYRELRKIFADAGADESEEIRCTQEFTDRYTAARSFALYQHLKLSGSDKVYTLMEVSRADDFDGQLKLNGGYSDIATVLMKQSGDYVLGSSSFKSENLFRYFYDFSGLSLDQRNKEAEEFRAGRKNIFYHKDSVGRDCIYICTEVPGIQWYSVTSVPLSSFHSRTMGMEFILWIAALLLLLTGFNIMWMRRSNRKLRESVQKEAEASAAKTDFLSRMSHDIRTPLNVITGSVVLAGKENNPPETKKYLQNIGQSSRFLLALVNDVLDLNKVESGKMELYPEPYSLKDLEMNLSSIIGPLCREKKIELRISGCDSEECYLLDSVRVSQIFFNILSNSVKFTPAGGHIGLECAVRETENNRVELKFRAYDDGKGMNREFQKHMFEAFSQEGQSGTSGMQGTGLGLAIVNNLVKLMNGTVRVQSEPGRGTEFFITISAVKSAEPDRSVKDLSVPPAVLQGKKVLLFEDNEINAEIAGRLLEEKGMEVTCAADGKTGLGIFQSSPEGHFDIILMDMRMPVMDGISATKAIRALAREDAKTVPIIAMTANAYDIDVRNCLSAGMNAHISKPVDPDRMYATIAQFIAKEEQAPVPVERRTAGEKTEAAGRPQENR